MGRVALLGVVLCIWVSTVSAQNWEFQGALQDFLPQGSLWDNQAFGLEVRAIYWWDTTHEEKLGVAFSTGMSKWSMDNQVLEDTRIAGTGRTRSLEGDVRYIPLGVSLVSRRDVSDNFRTRATFELGLHQMFCDSDLSATQTLYVSGTPLGSDRLQPSCGDGLVGRIGIGMEWALHRTTYSTAILLNGGYQFDLHKGTAVEGSWTNISTELPLNAFYLQFGLAIPVQ